MTEADLPAVMAIERVSFPTPWSQRAFLYELRQNRVAHCWVARSDELGGPPVLAYLCSWMIAGEVHVTNLAVHPDWRRNGIARTLLETILERSRLAGAVRAILEVRPSNAAALSLYSPFGFQVVGRRQGYYTDTGEDALLMEADLTARAWAQQS